MKLLLAILATLFSIPTFAADCQNLAGSFFYSHNPGRRIKIEQFQCILTVTNSTSGGKTGAPVIYVGDGVWRTSFEDSKTKETYASIASADAYQFLNRSLTKKSGHAWQHSEIYKLRTDGNILVKSSITDGETSDEGVLLLVRE